MSETKRIVLLGKTGSGKSSLANTILGMEKFKHFRLINAPDFFHTDPLTLKAIRRYMEMCKEGPHAFLLVLKAGTFTQHDEAAVNIMLQYFSGDASGFTTVVFTHGADLKGTKTEDWLSQNEALSELVQKCGGRYHVVDNICWNNDQVEELLSTIKQIVDNRGRHYTILQSPTFKKYRHRLEEAPTEVQVAVFLGVSAVGALITSEIPWTEIVKMVTRAADVMAAGKVLGECPVIDPEMMKALTFCANLKNLNRRYSELNEGVSPKNKHRCEIQ